MHKGTEGHRIEITDGVKKEITRRAAEQILKMVIASVKIVHAKGTATITAEALKEGMEW